MSMTGTALTFIVIGIVIFIFQAVFNREGLEEIDWGTGCGCICFLIGVPMILAVIIWSAIS
jgi:ABC-type uncharacterized transport system permease subunit